MNILKIALTATLTFLLLWVCWSDIKSRRIPNALVIIILIISLCYGWLFNGHIQVIVPVLVLIIGIVLSSMNIIGAGDVKLTTALLFSFPFEVNQVFFFLVALFGLPLILGVCCYNFLRKKKVTTLPYGVAIASGFFITLLIT